MATGVLAKGSKAGCATYRLAAADAGRDQVSFNPDLERLLPQASLHAYSQLPAEGGAFPWLHRIRVAKQERGGSEPDPFDEVYRRAMKSLI